MAQHHEPTGSRAERGEPRLGVGDHAVGMLVSGRGRKNQHLVGTRALEQLGVVLGALLPLAPADEGEQTRRGRFHGQSPTAGPVSCRWLTGREPTPWPGGCTWRTRSSPIRPRGPRSTLLHVHRSGQVGTGLLEQLDNPPDHVPMAAQHRYPAAAGQLLRLREKAARVGSLQEELGGVDRQIAGRREGSECRQAAFGAARQQQCGPGLPPAGDGPSRAPPRVGRLEATRERPSLLQAAIGEGTVLVLSRPALAGHSVGVAHEVDGDCHRRLVTCLGPSASGRLGIGFFAFIITNFNNLSAIVFNSFAGLGLKAGRLGRSRPRPFCSPGHLAQVGSPVSRCSMRPAR